MTQFSKALFEQAPIVGILRNFSLEEVQGIMPIFWASGLTTVEITMNTPEVVSLIQWTLKEYEGKLNIGAGTVRTMEELNTALSTGAQFIVTPILNLEVIQACRVQQVPVFPGAYTPTEVFAAWEAGATAVKVFPAELGGIGLIKALKGPLDHIPLIPTGGVKLNNISDFFDLGIYGVGMGGQLFPKKLIQEGAWDALGNHFKALRDKLNQKL